MTDRDVFSWNLIIVAYQSFGFPLESLALFHQMQRTDVKPDQFTFASILPACAKISALEQGIDIHQSISRSGFLLDVVVRSALIDMYAKCGSIKEARELFDTMPQRDTVSWTAMIAGYAQNGFPDEALRLFNEMPQPGVAAWTAIIAGYAQMGFTDKALKIFKQMQQAGVKPNSATFASIISVCTKTGAFEKGMEIHQSIKQARFLANIDLGNSLIDMYTKCGNTQKALELFDSMPERDVVSWTTLIAGYAQNGPVEKALETLKQMQLAGVEPDAVTFAIIVPACAKMGSLEQCMDIHETIRQSGFFSNVEVGNALIDMYSKCKNIHKAHELFDTMPHRDVVSWNRMIAGYAQNGYFEKALEIFKQMQETSIQPDQFTFASILRACAKMRALTQGIHIHQRIIRSRFLSDGVVGNALIDMYAKCGSIKRARQLFDTMPQRDLISWTAMITGYAQNGFVNKALKLSKEKPCQDVISLNAIIAGYAQNGLVEKALEMFKHMQLAGLKPDSATFASILPVCAKMGALEQGMEFHQRIMKRGIFSNVSIANALIDMYSKCGSIQKARTLFDTMPQQDVISWTTMIAGYGRHGYGKDALKLFELMKDSGTYPNHISFLCVLFACSHASLVDKGCKCFNDISNSYCIVPTRDHYICMIDLLGRAGYLEEALTFIVKMPIKPDAVAWTCLLGSCRSHKNIDLGEFAANLIFQLDPIINVPYILLSDIYAEVGRWDKFHGVRRLMEDRRVTKIPGCSWIELDRVVHAFFARDRSHPQTREIYAKLEKLFLEMKTVGYVPDSRHVLNDVEGEEKELFLYHHSEKLAIAFGLLNTSPGSTIRVVKNLRTCVDSHTAIKFISKVVVREIVVRDANRFHHFKNGHCSCGDYW
ncbi:putative pentatricopeptide repeat-containing protein At3g49142 isoform X2 [Cryptomeria japonica]|nr:putative pentatricopeptide repeat-containing protein At3g49142 isoform X2 [Cryptomeria japonica]